MPKQKVPLLSHEIYHIYNRGVDKRSIFEEKVDYFRFYNSLAVFNTYEPTLNFRLAQYNLKNSKQQLVQILAYNLLPNHYHLVLKQVANNGISEFMKRVSGGYTSYFNEKYYRSGSLFQGLFKRVHIAGDKQFNYVLAYVNENHVVHNIKHPAEIIYTSSLHYQKKFVSKLIENTNSNLVYDHKDSVALAKKIFKERKFKRKDIL